MVHTKSTPIYDTGNMATASVAFKSREDHRKQMELEEARKAGLAPAESLKHQRKWKSDPNYTKSWYDRGAKIYQADKYRKGACEKKAWRLFTAKLQTKLIRRSNKSIKKNRQHLNISITKPLFWSALSIHSHFKRKRRITKLTHHHPQRYRLQKRPTPVYIDQLFKEPESTLKKEYLQPAAKKVTKEDGNNGINRTSRGSTAAAAAGDDMWESLALATPQMYGINERAEEFITRFRAQMHSQESLASHL
ncbi:hypothetical protein LguiB_005386 [Lonicera macranthoides]